MGKLLKNGHTKSCWCLRLEGNRTIHGHNRTGKTTSTYNTWQHIIQRCTNPNNKDYKDYGSRGIAVCDRWLKFKNFLKDMGECPDGHTIERKKNSEEYSPENCKWATRKQQARNRRNNHLITAFGKIQCLAAWSEETEIPEYVIRDRLKRGWSPEKTLTTPVKKGKTK